jgi:LPS sulfotransferase NodH
VNKFCIFAGARTGSTSLYNFFKDAGVRIRFEPFRPNRWKNEIIDIRTNLEEIYAHSDGIKHLWDHFIPDQNEEMIDWMNEKDIKVIFLHREQVFFQALSRALAFQTDFWGTKDAVVEETIQYELKELQPILGATLNDYIQMILLAERIYKSLLSGADTTYWSYEELYKGNIDERIAKVHEILKFLEIEPDPYTHKLILEFFDSKNKVNSQSVYERIPNWNELKEIFQIEGET